MRTVVVAGLLLVIVGGVYFGWRGNGGDESPNARVYSRAEFTKPYQNDEFKFSFMMPQDFAARGIPVDETGGTMVLVESDSHADGIQILVTPFDEDLRVLTKERIEADVPTLRITEPQPVEIGENYTGLAFKSDNSAFDGASREVWFVFRGNLYQISTYDRLDTLLQNMFATWKFF